MPTCSLVFCVAIITTMILYFCGILYVYEMIWKWSENVRSDQIRSDLFSKTRSDLILDHFSNYWSWSDLRSPFLWSVTTLPCPYVMNFWVEKLICLFFKIITFWEKENRKSSFSCLSNMICMSFMALIWILNINSRKA